MDLFGVETIYLAALVGVNLTFSRSLVVIGFSWQIRPSSMASFTHKSRIRVQFFICCVAATEVNEDMSCCCCWRFNLMSVSCRQESLLLFLDTADCLF